MLKAEILDLLETIKQINETLKSIEYKKTKDTTTQEEFDDLHKEEFRLFMEESKAIRRLESKLEELSKVPEEMFYVNRIRKTVGLGA